MLTEDQRALLEDKVALWTQNAATGNMGLRDYNRRCAEALTAALASKGEALPVVSEEMVEAGAQAIVDERWAGSQPGFDRKPPGWKVEHMALARACITAALSLPRDTSDKGEEADVWARIGADDRLKRARQRLSLHELRMIVDHARARPVPGVSWEEVATALEPFVAWAKDNVGPEGWEGLGCQRERVCDWFGPSDFRRLSDLIALLSRGEGS